MTEPEFCARIIKMALSRKKIKFNDILFTWHKKNYRDMPWRETSDPYKILISEIMLQQTQVERVRVKYVEFLKKFPNVRTLAQASLGEVLSVWSGLGYNRRAKYLHECAKNIVVEYGGKFPNDFEKLKKLPGIGISTAGALLAFSFGQETPMIDTNIRRILTRTFFNLEAQLPSDKALYAFAQTLIPKGKGRVWNYAMLDLGALCCTARNHSQECPLMKLHGKVGDFVYKKPQKKFKDSRRFYRGQILKLLTEKKTTTLVYVRSVLKLEHELVDNIVDDLLQEALLAKKGKKLTLP